MSLSGAASVKHMLSVYIRSPIAMKLVTQAALAVNNASSEHLPPNMAAADLC